MKIAFVWAHWIWKKELINEIKKEFPNFTYIEKIPKKILNRMWKNINDTLTFEEKLKLQLDIFNIQEKKEILNNNFITERSIIDNIVYSKWTPLHDLLKEYVKVYIKKFPYDKIYFLKKEFFNNINDDYIDAIQIELLSTLNELGVDYEILIWQPRERIKKITTFIKNKMNTWK